MSQNLRKYETFGKRGEAVDVPDKFLCRICETWKLPDLFSKKEIKSVEEKNIGNVRRVNGMSARLRCRACAGDQMREMRCNGPCNQFRGLQEFSKNQRSQNQRPWCLKCVNWKESTEPNVTPQAYGTGERAVMGLQATRDLGHSKIPDPGAANLRSASTGFHPASSNGYTPMNQSNPLMAAHSSSMPNVTSLENDDWANGDAWTTVTRSRPGRSSVPTMTSAQSVSASTDRESKWAKVRPTRDPRDPRYQPATKDNPDPFSIVGGVAVDDDESDYEYED